ncbi:MAG: hypothetical protein K8T10_10770 [Candidatus Eremiobacteraeota bacterium]|nr:hypothetical protein [Candidatus Eremiobacteraeota bacterium]
MKKILAVLIMIILTQSAFAYAGDITFSTDSTEHYFPCGESAVITIETENTYGKTVNGILGYSITQDVHQSGLTFSSSNSKSTNMRIGNGKDGVKLDFGTSNTPTTYKIKLSFFYDDDKGGQRSVTLDDITIHFTNDIPKNPAPKKSAKSSSEKISGSSGGGGGGGGSLTDSFDRIDRMEQEMNRMFQRSQKRMDNMMNRTSPRRSMSKSPQKRMQNNQMQQDSNALKQSMEKQLEEQKKMKEDFRKNIAKNEEFQKKHQEMTDKGYKLKDEKYKPSSKKSGDFEMNYKKENGDNAKLKGKMEDGEMKKMDSLTAEDKKKIEKKLGENQQFKKFDKELKKQGFKKKETGVEKSGDKTTTETQYEKENGEKAKIKSEIENNEVKKVEMEKEKEEEKPKSIAALLWLLPFLLILALVAYLLYKKYYTRKPAQAKAGETLIAEETIDPVSHARKLIEEAKEEYSQGQQKDAYGKAGYALRIYLRYKNGLAGELTNDELIRYLKKSGNNVGKVKECFDLCNLVEFAKYEANDDDFKKIVGIAEGMIR